MQSSTEKIYEEIKHGETDRVEFKNYVVIPTEKNALDDMLKDLANEAAAMSFFGGVLYLGIEDNGEIKNITGIIQD